MTVMKSASKQLKHKPLKIRIRRNIWTVYYLTCGEYILKHDKHSDAITTYCHSKQKPHRAIAFRLNRFTPVAVRHELMHAYFSYFNMQGKTYSQTEEAMCEKLSRHWQALERNAKRIVKGRP